MHVLVCRSCVHYLWTFRTSHVDIKKAFAWYHVEIELIFSSICVWYCLLQKMDRLTAIFCIWNFEVVCLFSSRPHLKPLDQKKFCSICWLENFSPARRGKGSSALLTIAVSWPIVKIFERMNRAHKNSETLSKWSAQCDEFMDRRGIKSVAEGKKQQR